MSMKTLSRPKWSFIRSNSRPVTSELSLRRYEIKSLGMASLKPLDQSEGCISFGAAPEATGRSADFIQVNQGVPTKYCPLNEPTSQEGVPAAIIPRRWDTQ